MTKRRRRILKARRKRWAKYRRAAENRRIQDAIERLLGDANTANWPVQTTRIYAIDSEHGDDANRGFTDTGDPTFAQPIKTMDRLNEILPVNGAGRRVLIMFKGDKRGHVLDRNGQTAKLHLTIEGYSNVDIRAAKGVVAVTSMKI